MYGVMQHAGPEVPLTILLFAIMFMRARVYPRTSLHIKASPQKVWDLVCPFDGKTEHWGRLTLATRLVDAATQTFELTFSMPMQSGAMRSINALFRVMEREDGSRLVMKRLGLEGKSENNELLEIRHEIKPEGQGTRIKTTYVWGKRALLAQLLARTDLWGSAYRLKSMAETGQHNERPLVLIGVGVALVTGLISVAAFGLVLGFNVALILIFALIFHEFGHLLAFRLTGQPWGRLVFLPFLGAIAVPRLPFESQAQSVFSALMGPGLSCLPALACAVPVIMGHSHSTAFAVIGIILAGLNLFNMLPAEPLDGGIALRSVLSRLVGAKAQLGLILLGMLIMAFGYAAGQTIIMLFGGFAIVSNLKTRKIDAGLMPLTSLQVCIAILGYVAITAAHYTLLFRFMESVGL
jgi:Zn-dependent protease